MKITLQSPNISGTKWIKRLEKAGYQVESYAKEILESKEFTPTSNSYDIVILKMDKDYVTTEEVRNEAKKRGYRTPPVELAPLLRESISDKEMEEIGLWWFIVMHESITASGGDPGLLGLRRNDAGQWFDSYWDDPGSEWGRLYGFVFLAPQVSELGSQSSDLALEPLSFDLFEIKIKIGEKEITFVPK